MPSTDLPRLGRFVEPRDGEPTDLLGVPVRVHYRLLGALAFLVSGVSLLFALTPSGAPLRHPVVVAICAAGLAVPLLFAAIGRYDGYEYHEWAVIPVFLLSIVGPFICHYFIGDLKPEFLTLYMLGPIGAAYYLPMRHAWPIILAGLAAILYISSGIDEPDAMARGVVVVAITLATAMMLARIRSDLERTVESNQEISERDPLTGAFNLHRFHDRLDRQIERANENHETFTLVEFDLDRFGDVNEQYGREVGNEVLIATAEAIQSTLTPWDVLVRRGGDQFVVIAPFLSSRNLHATTLLARDRIAAVRRAICPDLVSTACAGWAPHREGEDATSLINRANQALLESKRASALTSQESRVWRDLREAPQADRSEGLVNAEVLAMRRRRAEEAAIGEDPMAGAMRVAWRTASLSTMALSLALLVMGLTDQLSFSLGAKHYALFIGWALVFSPLAFWLTLKPRPAYYEHLLCAGALGLTTLTCLVGGSAAPAAVEMFMMGALLFMMLLPFRLAAVYALAAYALYAGFLFGHDYPHAAMRSATTLASFGMIGFLLALTRYCALKTADEKAALAYTDALTGIANERCLREWLPQELERCHESGIDMAVLAIDIDEFKELNDKHGYSAGDSVLRALARAIAQCAGPDDLAARRDEDDFVLVLPGADQTDAERAKLRVTEAVRFARCDDPEIAMPSVSIASAQLVVGESAEQLLARSDDNLYELHEAGEPAHGAGSV